MYGSRFPCRARIEPHGRREVLYAVESQVADEYDLCEGAGLVLDKRWPRAVWSEVADALRERLGGMPHPGRAEWSDRGYRRGRLVERIVELLDRAGRSGEVVPLYESEVAAGGPHEILVKRLIEDKRLDDAACRAEEGIAQSPPDHEGARASRTSCA